jgi:hypothetical protein
MKRITSVLTCGAIALPTVVAGVDMIQAVRPAGSTFELQVAGVAGVPSDASAVVLNLTSAGASGTGYTTAYPCDEARPNASNLNYGVGAPVANSAIVKVAGNGTVCLFTADNDTELIADVNGYFPANSDYHAMTPARLLDTRRPNATVDGDSAGEGLRRAGTVYELQVGGRAGVPSDAAAVVLNLTAAEARGTGYATAYPCGEAIPNASNLNYGAGTPVANSAIVKVGTDGNVCLYTADTDTHLIADVNGWLPTSAYESMTPSRLLDTRRPQSTVDGIGAGEGIRGAGSIYPLEVFGRAGVPVDAAAVVLNITSAGARGTGYLTAYPCDAAVPNASNLNYGVGAPVANSAIVDVASDGTVCLLTADTDTQLIADVNGYFPAGSGYTAVTSSRLLDTRDLPPPSTGAAFVATFDGGTGMEHFRTGVFHRNPAIGFPGGHGGNWTGDHDLACGSPETQRQLESSPNDFNLDEVIYLCKDHMMTSMGDVDGYSVLWFAPNQTFNGQSTVSWDVNVTDLEPRQWWEVAIIPAGSPEATAIDWIAGTANLEEYSPGSVVVGNGPFGGDFHVHSAGVDRKLPGICSIDPEGCASKALRRPWSVADNGNGTITIRFGDYSSTVPGSFPTGGFEVVFKDHNYTPDKDQPPVGHTWHWDNIVVE